MSKGDDPGFDFVGRAEQLRNREVTPRRQEMRRLADAGRRVIERLVATQAPEDVLAKAADALTEIAAELEGYPQGNLYEGFGESANAGDPHAFFDHSPVMGLANPIAPPLSLWVEDGVVLGRARFGSAYEGPPHHVHGGYIAAAFDEVLGMCQSMSGRPGMTANLTVNYRKPTPLRTELRFEGRLVRVDGRKIFTEGRVYNGEVMTAEAEGLFISIDFAAFAQKMRDQKG